MSQNLDIVPVELGKLSDAEEKRLSEIDERDESQSRFGAVVTVIRKQMGENMLLVATIIAVVFGISLGFLLRAYCDLNDNHIGYFSFVGQLFLRMLKFLILPLIATSLISGIASLGSQNAGKIATRALVYYFSTTMIAVVIGIILVIIIRPGSGKASSEDKDAPLPIDTTKYVTTHDTLLDLVRNLFPDNIVEMTFQEFETNYSPQYKYIVHNVTSNRTIVYKHRPSKISNFIKSKY